MNMTQLRLCTLAAACLALCGPAGADSIKLRASVRLAPNAQVVRLADVAGLEGDAAEQHADLVVADVPNSASPFELSIRAIRARLDAADVHWGRVNLSGRSVTVRPHARPTAGSPSAMTAASLDTARQPRRSKERSREVRSAHEIMDAQTLRGVLARHMVESLELDPRSLRLEFDADEAATLNRSTADWRFEIVPEGNLRSELVTLVIRMWQDGRVVESQSIAFRPLIEVSTAVLRRDFGRNEVVTGADIEQHLRWMSPLQASLHCEPDVAVGRLASRPLRAGEALRHKHVRRETLVQRGDRVNVRCLVGGVAIALQAEARADGAKGEVVEFRKIGERDTFQATIVGRGEAVLDLNNARRES